MSEKPSSQTGDEKVVDQASASANADIKKRSKDKREIGGPRGPEPTRYGDWEKGGRCFDF